MNEVLVTAPTSAESLSEAARGRLLRVRCEPLFYSEWLRAMFIHFEVDAEALQRDVPFELELDDGRAYVSLVAFTMRNMRPRMGGRLGAWLMRPVANADYLNFRAYVRHRGDTGIYFLAEWLSNPLSLMFGPPLFGLPYYGAKCDYRHHHETGRLKGSVVASGPSRAGQGGVAVRYEAKIDPGATFSPCPVGSRDEFLLERYAAFTARYAQRFFRIWHPPWPQTPVDATLTDTSLLSSRWQWFGEGKLIGAHHSPGFERVWMGRPRFIPE